MEQEFMQDKLEAYIKECNPPQVYMIKDFLDYANREFDKYEEAERKEFKFKKYTFKMLIKDLLELEFIEDISYDEPYPVYIINRNKKSCSLFFLKRCINTRKMRDYHFKIYSENAPYLLKLIERLYRDMPFHLFRCGNNLYFCDIHEMATTINPTGRPYIKKYDMTDFVERHKENFKQTWEV